MRTYLAVVHKDEHSAYGVHFPDVPSCHSAADDINDLPAMAAEALALAIEGEELPDARDIHAIREAAREDLDEGAFLIAVPLIALTGRTAKANITMDAGLLSAIDATAAKRGLTRSAFIADLARREISG